MIFENSRYENDVVIRVRDAAKVSHPAIYVDPFVDERDFTFTLYTVTEGERLDLLAAEFYGDSELWWLIARANPEVFYPENIEYGTILRIPDADAVL